MKAEIALQSLDEWMIRWRKYQTAEDWQIEKAAQAARQRNYALTGAVAGWIFLYTAAPSTLSRFFGPPHFWDMGFDVAIKANLLKFFNGHRRWCPNGYGRMMAVGAPSFLLLATLQHFSEVSRYNAYLRQPTVFGEQARRLKESGKIEEFLCVNIRATLPAGEESIYGVS